MACRTKIVEIIACHDLIFTLAHSGVCTAFNRGKLGSRTGHSGSVARGLVDGCERRTHVIDAKVANQFGTGDRKWPSNDGQIPNSRVVRVHVSTGYNRVEGNRRASRNGLVSDLPPGIPHVTIRNFCIAVRHEKGAELSEGRAGAANNKRVCYLNVDPQEEVKSLFYNKVNESIIQVCRRSHPPPPRT
jgi:hypothetical protein